MFHDHKYGAYRHFITTYATYFPISKSLREFIYNIFESGRLWYVSLQLNATSSFSTGGRLHVSKLERAKATGDTKTSVDGVSNTNMYCRSCVILSTEQNMRVIVLGDSI